MPEIFKWGVSIFLSLCVIAALFIVVGLLGMLSEAYPEMFEAVFAGGFTVLIFGFLIWAGAQAIYTTLFE